MAIGLGWTIILVGLAAAGVLGAEGAIVAAVFHNLSTLIGMANAGRLLRFDEPLAPVGLPVAEAGDMTTRLLGLLFGLLVARRGGRSDLSARHRGAQSGRGAAAARAGGAAGVKPPGRQAGRRASG